MMNVDISVNNGYISYNYRLGPSEMLDERAVEMIRKNSLKTILPFDVRENGRLIIGDFPEQPSLRSFLKNEIEKQDMLDLLKKLAEAVNIGPKGIPVSAIMKDIDHIFVNPETREVSCMAVPVKKDRIDLSEFAALFRDVLANAAYSAGDKDNYAARLITCVNAYDFTTDSFVALINTMLYEMPPMQAPAMSNNVRVNKMDVLRERARSQGVPY